MQGTSTDQVTMLIRTLSDRIVEVLEQLAPLTDAELDAHCVRPEFLYRHLEAGAKAKTASW